MASSQALRQGARQALWAFVLVGACLAAAAPAAGFSILHNFTGGAADGAFPQASLILDASSNLYGTTVFGGSADQGTVFTMKTDGTGFKILHSFTGGAADGARPNAALLLDAIGNLYGTTPGGGSSGLGTVFTMKTDGTGFTVLHHFAGFAGGAADGSNPAASLLLDGAGNLYGTTIGGGSADSGTVFTLPAPPTAITVGIDIQPGSFPNMIDLAKKRQISVAILTTASFDAATVDPATVRFGATGTEAAPVDSVLQVIDRAGHTRLLLGFLTQETRIACGDTSASLTGKTFSGQAIQGSDTIQTVGCP